MTAPNRLIVLGTSVALLSGCHTLTSVVSGPALGGASLTSRLWSSDSNVGAKILVTPFAFAAGTITGPMVALPRAANLDLERHELWFESEGYLSVLDPFQSGLFARSPRSPAASSPGGKEQVASSPTSPVGEPRAGKERSVALDS